MTSCHLMLDGTRHWRDLRGDYHRDDGPAIEYPDGGKKWCQHGMCHRKNGPAVVLADGSEAWYCLNRLQHGQLPNGFKQWGKSEHT